MPVTGPFMSYIDNTANKNNATDYAMALPHSLIMEKIHP